MTDAWDLLLNNVLDATPVFQNDRGFFPINEQIVAYDVRHGTQLWVAPARALFEPTIGEDLLFLIQQGAITSLRTDTGVEAWKVELTDKLAAPLSLGNGWLIATTEAGSVLAFRARDGGLIWRRELDAPIRGSASISDDRVYLPMTDGRIIALEVGTGEPRWERRLGGAPNQILSTPHLVYSGSNDNYFYALRAKDGVIEWRWPTGGDVIGRAALDSRRVYFVSFDNVLRALDRNTGNQRWKRTLPLRPTRGPVVMDDALIVSGLSASAAVFAMKDGASIGSISGPGELAAPPHVVGGEGLPMLLLVSRDLEKGTIARALTRSIEPDVSAVKPLPNPVPPPAPPPDEGAQPAETDRATGDGAR